MNNMLLIWKKIIDNKVYRMILGTLGGGILGFSYWYFIGCTGGSCPLTSDPYKTTGMFALLGLLFAKDKKEKKNTEE
ncbi:MAG: hypothetical protein JEZ09_10875 [Salinivirgaceae bacterium]|nr:hypothetical protein [Salinivirgaceae bacterium]